MPNEGEITFDVRFYVITQSGERVKLILNVEIQKDYYPGYDLDTIAMELEENKDVLLPIYTAVLKTAPDYDISKVSETLHHK